MQLPDFHPIEEIADNPIEKMERHLGNRAFLRWKQEKEKALRRLEEREPAGFYASMSHWALTCPRRIRYAMQGLSEPLGWRSQAVFRTGDMEEAALYSDLVSAGVEIRGTQLSLVIPHRFLDFAGNPACLYVGVRLDGIIRVCPDTQAVLEFKTAQKYELQRWSPTREKRGKHYTGRVLPANPSLGTVTQANMGLAALRFGHLVKYRESVSEEGSEPEKKRIPYQELCATSPKLAMTELIEEGVLDGPVDTACLIGLAKESQYRKGLLFEFDYDLYAACMTGFEIAWNAWQREPERNVLPRGFQPFQKTRTTEPELGTKPNGGCAYCPSKELCWSNAMPFRPTQDEFVIRLGRPDAPIPEEESTDAAE